MNVARVTVPVAAALIISTGSAVASPQSMLDPYANIKAPTTKQKLSQTVAKPAKESRVSPKASKVDDSDIPPPKAIKAAKTTSVSSGESGNGFISGTKEIFHGVGAATKGAAADVVHPVKVVGGGVVSGGKKVGSTLADGAKTATTKVKDATGGVGKAVTAAPKKVGEGLKTAGAKIKDGTVAAGKAVTAAPKAVGRAVGGAPKAVGNGIAGAASKTGETAKKVGETAKKAACAPFHLAARLNPFRHKEVQSVASQTESVQK
ncbi:MAG TPA: hypothetical protein V6D22_09210 [Candidatus Obscuribacterales bacterium]